MVRSMHKLVIFAALLSQSMKISIQMKFSEQTEMVSSNLRRYYLHSHTTVQNMHAIWWGWVLYIPNQWHWMYKQLHSCYETMENSHEVTISTKFRLLTIISTAFLIVNFFWHANCFPMALSCFVWFRMHTSVWRHTTLSKSHRQFHDLNTILNLSLAKFFCTYHSKLVGRWLLWQN